MKLLFVGSLSAFQLTVLTVLYLAAMCYLIYIALTKERGIARLLWVLAILFIPFVGFIAYLLKHFFLQGDTTNIN